MRLELGGRVDCSDGIFGELADVVIDPTTKGVTHLVVKAQGEPWVERLVPVELVHPGDPEHGSVRLRVTAAEVRSLPPVQEVAYLQLGDFPLDDPDWDVGIQEVYALPYYATDDLQPRPLDFPVMYDRIPKGEVEIRRASGVYSAEGHHLGHVDGFLVDRDEHITHLVLERGHLWGLRDVTIPIGALAKVETDAVTLSLTKDQAGSLPEGAVRRWPSSSLPGRRPARGTRQRPGAFAHGSGDARRGSGLAATRDRVHSTTRMKGGAMAGMENVVVVGFAEPSKAYQALTVLKQCDAEGRIALRSAAVVERTSAGELRTPEGADNVGLVGTASGSVIGMLIGVLGGPVGVLVGWGAGALMGGVFDIARAEKSDEALSALGRAIPLGSTAVIAGVEEPAVEVIDGEMAKLGGEVTRRPLDEVMDELEAAEEAAEAAAFEARRTLAEERKVEVKADFDERVGKLKEKLHVS
jgi:uncharacterized membrane protein